MSMPKKEYASGASAAKRSSWRQITAFGIPVVGLDPDVRAGPQAGATAGKPQPRRPLVELPPGAPPLALDERRVVRDRVGHGLEHRPEVPVHGPSLTSSGAAYAATMAALPAV